MGSFVFKWPHPNAQEVYVTGTFDDWAKTTKLDKVGDHFEKDVPLSNTDEKILYKFVVDGDWTTDHTADKEDDGHNNINNVLHPENIKKDPSSAAVSSAAPGSTTAALAGGVPLEQKQSAPGAFPETPANELDQQIGVAPLPATSGAGNPVSVPAGEKVPENVTASTVQSTATTSKEDYDNAGSSEMPAMGGEAAQFGVNPIPASSGIGNPVQTKPGEGIPEQVTTNTVDSTATTSKEDYEKAGSYGLPAAGIAAGGVLAGAAAAVGLSGKDDDKKNLIPESSLPIGQGADSTLDAGPHIQSSGPSSTTAALAGNVPLEKDKVAAAVPAPVQESLSEAHQSAEAASSPEAVKDKESLEKELLSKVPPSEAQGEHANPAAQTSYHGLATTVPATVEKSMEQANAAPEAAADTSAVAEKTQLEQELKQKVPESNEAGESAPTATSATSAVAPGTSTATSAAAAPGTSSVAAAALADGAGGEDLATTKNTTTTAEKTEGDATEYAPPVAAGAAPGVSSGAAAALSDGADAGLADEPAVKLMNQNEDAAAPTTTDGAADTKKEPEVVAPPAATTTTATESKPVPESKSTTEDKSTTAAAPPSSAPSTPTKNTTEAESPAGKDKKKKHRISSFFKKIFD
ncbi:uncharacterized protein HMPREF1541_01860 [Cyphellophora europaea CBS 101466]|uniref:AMP-activated protein kinase glycogen-binding domain-containing protein n=1 Tax=Cyphellophora europaea (strain CBS 101466) TaxID=1220924 RepID=W2S1Z0_CYPE1|nr:uncharacterized protein HMPREF1541_01860 [Cyphellophora europaea CBS 101466]ETN42702.1 hypothetical protein HMPREF1541_01860 [Cyphellophora europaea CBS 101466]